MQDDSITIPRAELKRLVSALDKDIYIDTTPEDKEWHKLVTRARDAVDTLREAALTPKDGSNVQAGGAFLELNDSEEYRDLYGPSAFVTDIDPFSRFVDWALMETNIMLDKDTGSTFVYFLAGSGNNSTDIFDYLIVDEDWPKEYFMNVLSEDMVEQFSDIDKEIAWCITRFALSIKDHIFKSEVES